MAKKHRIRKLPPGIDCEPTVLRITTRIMPDCEEHFFWCRARRLLKLAMHSEFDAFCHFGLDPLHERQRGNLEPKGAAH